MANRPADRLLGRLRPRRGDRPREEPAEFETASAGAFSSAEPFMSWLPEDSGSAPAAPGSGDPATGSSRMVGDEESREETKRLEPPGRPVSSWLPDDHSGHEEEANGQRWLPRGAGGTTRAQPEPAPSEPQVSAVEREPSDPESAAPEPQAGAAPEPDAFAASSRRTRAVEAYCAELCLPEQASAAATETLGSFVDGDDHHLLGVMRVVAAKHVDPLPDHRRGARRELSAEREGECSLTPSMLAARDNDELSEPEKAKLDDHCEACVTCQALELRSRRAERAFAAIMRMPVAAGAAAGREATVVTSEAAIAPAAEAQPEPAAEAQPAPEPRSSGASAWVPAELVSAEPRAHAGRSRTPAPPLGAGEPALREAGTVSIPVAEPGRSSRRRRSAIFGAATAGAAAAIAAAVLLTNGSNSSHPASQTNIAARPAATTPARHRAAKRAATAQKHQAAAQHPTHAVAAAAPAASAPAASAPVSASPATPSASSAPAATPSAPASSSAPPTSPPPASGSQPSSPPPVSIQQPSLGSVNAPQGVGK